MLSLMLMLPADKVLWHSFGLKIIGRMSNGTLCLADRYTRRERDTT